MTSTVRRVQELSNFANSTDRLRERQTRGRGRSTTTKKFLVVIRTRSLLSILTQDVIIDD